jgi:hypothetical protein
MLEGTEEYHQNPLSEMRAWEIEPSPGTSKYVVGVLFARPS